jgi:N6-adenosine-specific RNA methylase IME4/ParB-like chromosome segregation protein Spo0J
MNIELKKLTEHLENQKIYGFEGIINLQEKIEKSKWIKPIIVAKYSYIMDKENVIISGHRRCEVCRELGIKEIPFSYIELKDKFHEIEMLLLENEYRDKTKLQKVREAERWEQIEREKARERQSEGGKETHSNQHKKEEKINLQVRDNCPEAAKEVNSTKKESNETRDNVAAKVGFNSGKDYERSKKVVEKIDELESQGKKEKAKVLTEVLEHSTDGALKIVKEDEEIFDKTLDKIKETGLTNKPAKVLSDTKLEIKKEQYNKKIEAVEKEENSIDIFNTDKKFRIIYADPCWSYNDKRATTEEYTGAIIHYETMSIQEICNLPVKDIIENNAILFLWTTSPILEESFVVINKWGFRYKASFIWDKIKHNVGHYNSVRHEFLLIATKGSCTPDNKKLFDSVQSIEKTVHSKKPLEFIDIIDTLYEYGNRLEMFARYNSKANWFYWGNEV